MIHSLDKFPVNAPIAPRNGHNLPPSVWPDLADAAKSRSLRALAEKYGVSRETVRRTLTEARASGEKGADSGETLTV